MKGLRIKLFSSIAIFVLLLMLIIVGVWATTSPQAINISGDVVFSIDDRTLYIKNIRVREANDLQGEGTTIDDFQPGFIDGAISIDVGSDYVATTSFTLYFDIVNTSNITYEASTSSVISNAHVSASGVINGDSATLSNVANEEISGIIALTITVDTASNISLDGIVININEV